MIVGIDVDDEGLYCVVIIGLMGCIVEGVVNVSIEELFFMLVFELVSSICSFDDILLEILQVFFGSNV